jgi:hypothetical protein
MKAQALSFLLLLWFVCTWCATGAQGRFAGWRHASLGDEVVRTHREGPLVFASIAQVLEPHLRIVVPNATSQIAPSAVAVGTGLVEAVSGFRSVRSLSLSLNRSAECYLRAADVRFRSAECANVSFAQAEPLAQIQQRTRDDLRAVVASTMCLMRAFSLVADLVSVSGNDDAALYLPTVASTALREVGQCLVTAGAKGPSSITGGESSLPALVASVSLAGWQGTETNVSAIMDFVAEWRNAGVQGLRLINARLASSTTVSCDAFGPLPTVGATLLTVDARKQFLQRLTSSVNVTAVVTLEPCVAEFSVTSSGSLLLAEALVAGGVVRSNASSARTAENGFGDSIVFSPGVAWRTAGAFVLLRPRLANLTATVAENTTDEGVGGLTTAPRLQAWSALLAALEAQRSSSSAEAVSFPLRCRYIVPVVLNCTQNCSADSTRTQALAAQLIAAKGLTATFAAVAAPGSSADGWANAFSLALVPIASAAFNATAKINATASALASALRFPSAEHATAWRDTVDTPVLTARDGISDAPTAAASSSPGRTVFVALSLKAEAVRVPYWPIQQMFGGKWPVAAAPTLRRVSGRPSSAPWYEADTYANILSSGAKLKNFIAVVNGTMAPVTRIVLGNVDSSIATSSGMAAVLAAIDGFATSIRSLTDVCILLNADASVSLWQRVETLAKSIGQRRANGTTYPKLCAAIVPSGTFTVIPQTGRVGVHTVDVAPFIDATAYAAAVGRRLNFSVQAFVPAQFSAELNSSAETVRELRDAGAAGIMTPAVDGIAMLASAAASVSNQSVIGWLTPVYWPTVGDLVSSGVSPVLDPARTTASTATLALDAFTAFRAFMWASFLQEAVPTSLVLRAVSDVRWTWVEQRTKALILHIQRHLLASTSSNSTSFCLRDVMSTNSLHAAQEHYGGTAFVTAAAQVADADAAAAVLALTPPALSSFSEAFYSAFGAAALPPTSTAFPSPPGATCEDLPRTLTSTASETKSVPLPTSTTSATGSVSDEQSDSFTNTRRLTRSDPSASESLTHALSPTLTVTAQRAVITAAPKSIDGAAIRSSPDEATRRISVRLTTGSARFDPAAFADQDRCTVSFKGGDGTGNGFALVGTAAAPLPASAVASNRTVGGDASLLRIVQADMTSILIVIPNRGDLRLRMDETVTLSVPRACFSEALPGDQLTVSADFLVTANAARTPLGVSAAVANAGLVSGATASAAGAAVAAVLGGAVASSAVTASRGRLLIEAARCQLAMAEELPFMAHPFGFAIDFSTGDETPDPTRYYLGSAVGNLVLVFAFTVLFGCVAAYWHCNADPTEDEGADGNPRSDPELEMAIMAHSARTATGGGGGGPSPPKKGKTYDASASSGSDEGPLLDSWLKKHVLPHASSPGNKRSAAKVDQNPAGRGGATHAEHTAGRRRRAAAVLEQRRQTAEEELKRDSLWHRAFAKAGFPSATSPLLLLLIQDALVGAIVPVINSPFVGGRVLAGLLLLLVWLPIYAFVFVTLNMHFASVWLPDGTTQKEQRARRAAFLQRVAKYGLAKARSMQPREVDPAVLSQLRRGAASVKSAFEAFFEGRGGWQDDEDKVQLAESVVAIGADGKPVALPADGGSSPPATRHPASRHIHDAVLVRGFTPPIAALFHPRGFTARFAALFEPYRASCQSFLGVELALAGGFSTFVALQPTLEALDHGCVAGWGAMCALFAAFTAVTIILRPYAAWYELTFSLTLTVLQLIIAAVSTGAYATGDPSLLGPVDIMAIVLLFLPLVKLGIDLLFNFVYKPCVAGGEDDAGSATLDAAHAGSPAQRAIIQSRRQEALQELGHGTDSSHNSASDEEPYFKEDPLDDLVTDSDGPRHPGAPRITRRQQLRKWRKNTRAVDDLLLSGPPGQPAAAAAAGAVSMYPPVQPLRNPLAGPHHHAASPSSGQAPRHPHATPAQRLRPARSTRQFHHAHDPRLRDDSAEYYDPDMDDDDAIPLAAGPPAPLRQPLMPRPGIHAPPPAVSPYHARPDSHLQYPPPQPAPTYVRSYAASSVGRTTANVTVATSPPQPFRQAALRQSRQPPDPYDLL